MQRTLHRLVPLEVQRVRATGFVHDGGGLYLQVTRTGAKSWVFRFMLNKRRRDMGLGAFPAVSLAAARKLASEARSQAKAGHDPIEARNTQRSRQRREQAQSITFDQATEQFLATREGEWRSDKHRQQWRNTLASYASPKIGSLSVAAISKTDVIRVLDPIWREKERGGRPETAARLRGRIEEVLNWAVSQGYREEGLNPARWSGHLEHVFAKRSKLQRVRHHAAVSIDELPEVYAKLRELETIAALALRFLILTAARAGEVTGLTWDEIDFQEKVWTVPASRIKAAREHRVPLSSEALAILTRQRDVAFSRYVFPGFRDGRPLSWASLSKALDATGYGSATVHGFRSTFRDWTSERTDTPRDVAEMALAHTIEDRTEAAYRRGELMTKRAVLMQRWATFATTPHIQAEVVQFGAAINTRDAA
jgi:integrase